MGKINYRLKIKDFKLKIILFSLSVAIFTSPLAEAQVTTQTFICTSANQTWVVPCGVFSIDVQCWGGGGGGGGADGSGVLAPGGGGAYASGTFAVTPLTSLTMIAGCGGGAGVAGSGSGGGIGGFGLGNGGNGGNAGSSGGSGGGGGGGGGTGIYNGATLLIVAGGGGGAGGTEMHATDVAGAGGGGGVNGSPGNSCPAGVIGASGSTVGVSGSQPGGDDPASGGGGGGLVGGGAGALLTDGNNGSAAGGGAGGTSQGTTINNGAGTTAGNSGGCGGCAAGGAPSTAGGAGVLLITYNLPPTLTCSIASSGSCGSATATVTTIGGTTPYTWAWTPIGGTASVTTTNLTNGSYTATVTDVNGCVGTANTTISLPPSTVSGTVTNGPGACGLATATVVPGGGTGPYTFTWTPTGGNLATTTLANGNYTVNITDNAGCTGTATTSIVLPPALTLTAVTTSVTCNGLSTGSATATATGGAGGYTYGWAPNPPQISTTGIASGLAAGVHTVGVQDAAGCKDTLSMTIAQPNPLTVATTQTNVVCFGGTTGIATATPNGGTGPYSFAWSPSGGAAGTATNLAAQPYTVTVVDAHLCPSTVATLTITQTALAVTASTASTNITCNGLANGSATVTAGGGTAGYTYNWLPIGGTASVTTTNLTPQVYTVTITDANSCTTTATANITQPPALTLTAVTTSVTCFGLSNGSATATATGGVGPYTVGIITPPQGGPTTGTIAVSGLSATSYTFGVQDANGCQTIFPITIAQPTLALSATTATTNVSCFGGTNGSATVTAVGGTTGYTYSWSPIGGTASVTTNNLTAQVYTVTVTDANSCTTTATANITQPPAFTASITTSTNVSCFGGNDGSATATQLGGTGPYTYGWLPIGGTAITAVNLTAPQLYTVTVTDSHTCTATATVSIGQPTTLTLTAVTTSVTCFGLSNGCATVTPVGGTPTYTLGINSTPPQGPWICGGTPQPICGLTAGGYTIGVQDAHGCQDFFPITIAQPTLALSATTATTNITCNGLGNGSATVTAVGGTTGYAYSWLPIGGTASVTTNNLTPQVYTVTVTDANSCTTTATATITQPPALTLTAVTTSVTCNGLSTGSATATATGGIGPSYTIGINSTPTQAGATTGTFAASGLSATSYTFGVQDANGCPATFPIIITEPPVLTVSSTPKTICISNTATLTAVAVGGNTTQSYTYSVAGGIGNTAAVSPVTTTVYTLGVIDMKGCTATNTVTVFVRNPLSFLAVSPGKEMCKGFSATLNATGSGGDSAFTYTWYPGPIVGQNITVTPTVTTTYTLVLTDNCGTPSDTSKVTVTVDSLPKINFTADKQNGCYPLCVQFTSTTQITPSSIQSYYWNLGDGHNSTSANPLQCYTKSGVKSIYVSVISTKGCLSHDTINNMITVYNHPVANFYYSPNPATILEPTIQFYNTSYASGSVISNLSWQTFGDGSGSSSILPDPAHTYQDTGKYGVNLVVTNALGCKDSILQYVHILPFFTLYVPNAFTPNDDGFNDMFYAIGEYVSTFDMKIFDRWGTVVYHSTNINSDYGWNGSKGGAKAEEGVYVYLINATDAMHKPHSFNGTVTLIK